MNLRLWMEGLDVAVAAEDVKRIRDEHPESAGWISVGITHPLWMVK